ncbi:hypothetical protein [Streptomyces sp. cmx-4-9]
MGNDKKSTRWVGPVAEAAKRIAVALSARALWALIAELMHGEG